MASMMDKAIPRVVLAARALGYSIPMRDWVRSTSLLISQSYVGHGCVVQADRYTPLCSPMFAYRFETVTRSTH